MKECVAIAVFSIFCKKCRSKLQWKTIYSHQKTVVFTSHSWQTLKLQKDFGGFEISLNFDQFFREIVLKKITSWKERSGSLLPNFSSRHCVFQLIFISIPKKKKLKFTFLKIWTNHVIGKFEKNVQRKFIRLRKKWIWVKGTVWWKLGYHCIFVSSFLCKWILSCSKVFIPQLHFTLPSKFNCLTFSRKKNSVTSL